MHLRKKSTEVFLLENIDEEPGHIKSVHAACINPHPASRDLIEEPHTALQRLVISDSEL
jgi:hypothetical protein